MRRAIVFAFGFLFTVGVLDLATARAQSRSAPGGECVLRRGPNGMIRGDRVPSGCVLRPEGRERVGDEEGASGIFVGTAVVFVPVLVSPHIFLPDPPFVGVPPGPGAVGAAEGLPRIRSRPFGPLERPFGPVTQPFRPTNRDFDRARLAPDPTRPVGGATASPARSNPR